jgi:2-dehydropantoate 2-reductase
MADQSTLAFVGAGALGQTYAAQLAASGQPVTILSTPRSAARLSEAGTIQIFGTVDLAVAVSPAPAPAGVVGVTTDPALLPAGAGLIFTTKAHQLQGAIEALRGAWPSADDSTGWVAGLQNGVLKDDILAAAFGRERTVGAATVLSAQGGADGRISVRGLGMTYLGELDGSSSTRVRAAAAALEQAALPATATAEIQRVLWSKASHAAGIFGVSALARASVRQLMGSPDLVRGYLALLREAATVAEASGVELMDCTGFTVRTYLDQPEADTLAGFARAAESARSTLHLGEQYPSITQDLLAGRGLEVDEVFGDIVARAGRAGLDAPRLTLVRDLIRGIDPGRRAE